MAHFYNDDLEYVGDHYYDVVDFDDNPFGVAADTERDSDLDSVDSDDVEDNPESTRVRSDTTALEARNGKDMQGILWERLNFSREKYRERRLMEYKNYDENLPSLSRKNLGKKCLKVEKGKLFYEFQLNTRAVESTIVHFQGELVCKYLDQPGVAFSTKVTMDENAITNAVDIYKSPNGSVRIIAANNDAHVRVFDAESFSCLNCFSFDWSVNNASVSPDGKMLVILGDSTDGLIAEAHSGKVTHSLKGHLDYSFASAWHQDGRILATGNQDTTCRLWDIRNLSKSFAVLKGNMGAIRGLKFSSDGQFLAMSEPADFVHVFDTQSGYLKCQEIDLFGEIAGMSFSPDTEALFVGISDRTYGSLLEFNRKQYNSYLNCLF